MFTLRSIILFARFIAVGVLNSAFGYGLYAALIYLGLLPEIALFVATVLGVFFNFFTTGRLVFNSSDNKFFFRFVAVYAVIYICNATALRILVNYGVDPLIAQAVLLPISVIATFMSLRVFAFRDDI